MARAALTPRWTALPGGLRDRLVGILDVGGPRKVRILEAWARAAGFDVDDLQDVARDLMRGRQLHELNRPGPKNEDSGPYWSTTVTELGISVDAGLRVSAASRRAA